MAAGGGDPGRPGHYVEPTVVADLPHGHELERDELFLPFVTVTRVGSFDEALAEANAPVLRAHGRDLHRRRGREKERFLAEIEAGVGLREPARGRDDRRVARHADLLRAGSRAAPTGKGGLGAWYLPQFMREQSRTIVE